MRRRQVNGVSLIGARDLAAHITRNRHGHDFEDWGSGPLGRNIGEGGPTKILDLLKVLFAISPQKPDPVLKAVVTASTEFIATAKPAQIGFQRCCPSFGEARLALSDGQLNKKRRRLVNDSAKQRQLREPKHSVGTHKAMCIDDIIIVKQGRNVKTRIIFVGATKIIIGNITVNPDDRVVKFLVLSVVQAWPSATLKGALGQNVSLYNDDFLGKWK
jgi:hypothetical protein